MTADINQMISNLEEITNYLKSLKKEESNVNESVQKQNEAPVVEKPPQPEKGSFEHIKTTLMEKWPNAVEPYLICDQSSDDDKCDRATGILEVLINENLDDKKFLDFGCGEGHVAKVASNESKVAVGYDIEKQGSLQWEKHKDFLLTTNMKMVKKYGPYDVILLYDVIDHVVGQTAEELLKTAAELLAEDGKIYFRGHPWCSRHGGHIYQDLNKAFAHLVFTEEELESLGVKIPKFSDRKVIHPISSYRRMIQSAGLKRVSEAAHETKVEPFFERYPAISDRIKAHWKSSPTADLRSGKKFPAIQLRHSFVDYVIKK